MRTFGTESALKGAVLNPDACVCTLQCSQLCSFEPWCEHVSPVAVLSGVLVLTPVRTHRVEIALKGAVWNPGACM